MMQQNTKTFKNTVIELETYLSRKLTVEEYLAVKNDFESKYSYVADTTNLLPNYTQPVYVKDRWILPNHITCTTINNSESIGEFWDKQDAENTKTTTETIKLNMHENKEVYFTFWDGINEYACHDESCDCSKEVE